MTTMAYSTRVQAPTHSRRRSIAGPIALLAAALALAALAGTHALVTPPAIEAHVVPTSLPVQLQVRSADVSTTADYLIVTGEVRNVGNASLHNLEAVIESRDADGRLKDATEALTTIPSVAAGSSTPFKVYVATDGLARRCGIRFRTLLGAEVGATEGRG